MNEEDRARHEENFRGAIVEKCLRARKEENFTPPEGSEEMFLSVSRGAFLSIKHNIYLTIDYAFNRAWLNGAPFELDIEAFVSELLTIVSSWDERMVNEMILDGSYYSVEFIKNNKFYRFYGQNKFPYNFRDFVELLYRFHVVC